MILESFDKDADNSQDISRRWTLISLSIATSIDALAIGLTLAFLNVPFLYPCALIGVVAAVFSIVGAHLGKHFGQMMGKRIYIFGGIILIFLGFNILLTHLK